MRRDVLVFVVGMLCASFTVTMNFLNGYTGFFLFPIQPFLSIAASILFIPCAIAPLLRAILFRNSQRKLIALRVAMATGLLICGFTLWTIDPWPPEPFLNGLLSRMRHAVSGDQFQRLCVQLLNDGGVGDGFANFVDEFGETNRMPRIASHMWVKSPRFAEIVPQSGDIPRHVLLEWGGHFVGYWGVSAGDEHFVLPENPDLPRVEWVRGVYVWCRGEFARYP